MNFNLDDIVNANRETTAGYHFKMGRSWRLIGEEMGLHSPLAYSAFEFRFAIERYLFELLLLIRNKLPTKADLTASNKVRNLKKTIHKICGGKVRFERSLIFNRLYSQGMSSPPEIWLSIPDIDKLETFWGNLSEYCHRQLEPRKTWELMGNKWLLDGYRLLNTVESYLWEIVITSRFGWVRPFTMEPEMRTALDDFVSGKISQHALETRLSIMGPIITQRVREKRQKNPGLTDR